MKHVMYYAAYDIVEHVTRETLIQILKDAGLTRIQKSVFCGSLTGQQKKDLVASVKNVIDNETDSFHLIMNCNQCYGRLATVGKGFDMDYVSGKRRSMVI